jgi:peptidoglycan/LPS O-acetylase OafA/YrhL
MNNQHNRALDGLRWFAFLGVFLFHADERRFHYGAQGVQVFFVLSGFLIGRILLGLKAQDGASLRKRLKDFYIRRSLRIFPLFYFVLLVCWLLSFADHTYLQRRAVLPWHAAYLTNFYLFFTGQQIGSEMHLWSLCVEEHFYLLAPLFLLVVSIRGIERAFVALFCFVSLARLANSMWWHLPRLDLLSPMQFDTLAVGMAAALIEKRGAFIGLSAAQCMRAGAWCGSALLVLLLCAPFGFAWIGFADAVLLPPILAVASASLILTLWTARKPALNRLLSWPLFVYLGQISYGLYLYHNFLYVLAHKSTGAKHVLMLGGVLLVTIFVASVSWFLLERPINNLKRFFPYTPQEDTPQEGTASVDMAENSSAKL